jgi:hypothetical protein
VGFAAEAGLTGKALAGARAFMTLLDDLRAWPTTWRLRRSSKRSSEPLGDGDELRADGSDEARGRLGKPRRPWLRRRRQYETLLEFVERLALVSESDDRRGSRHDLVD